MASQWFRHEVQYSVLHPPTFAWKQLGRGTSGNPNKISANCGLFFTTVNTRFRKWTALFCFGWTCGELHPAKTWCSIEMPWRKEILGACSILLSYCCYNWRQGVPLFFVKLPWQRGKITISLIGNPESLRPLRPFRWSSEVAMSSAVGDEMELRRRKAWRGVGRMDQRFP